MPPFRPYLNRAIRNSSIPDLDSALSSVPPEELASAQSTALSKCVSAGSVSLTSHLLTSSPSASPLVPSLSPQEVASNPSIPLLSLLTQHGYDLNKDDCGFTLLRELAANEELLRWCVAQGADVKAADSTLPSPSKPTTVGLLEKVAGSGTLGAYKFLCENGAVPGRRVLHSAVKAAAKADVFEVEDEDGNLVMPEGGEESLKKAADETFASRFELVKFLVEEEGCDVNLVDLAEQLPGGGLYGTPLAYAFAESLPRKALVDYLLDKGADPDVKDVWGNVSARSLAEQRGDGIALNLLQRI